MSYVLWHNVKTLISIATIANLTYDSEYACFDLSNTNVNVISGATTI